jgi:hypothetical protein
MGKIKSIHTRRLVLREQTMEDFESVHEIKSNQAELVCERTMERQLFVCIVIL